MASITTGVTFNPSGYDSSNSSYSSIDSSYPISNAYTASDSTTYAYINTNTGSGAQTYVSLTFDLSSIPSDATINSVSCTAKGAMSTTTTSRMASAVMQLYAGITAKGSTTSFLVSQTSAAASSLTCGTWTRTELDNLELRFTCTRGTSRTTSTYYMYIYGADLTINYTYGEDVNTYTVSVSSTGNGTTTPTDDTEVDEGDDLTITMSPDDGYKLSSITVGGTEVTPTATAREVTYTYETNYSTYSGSLADVFDNDDTSYVWTAESPSAGKYVLVTFNQTVDLTQVYVYCNSATDKLSTESVLQCSTDGNSWTDLGTFGDTQATTFSNLSATGIKYLRIYATTSGSYWIQLSTINMAYTATNPVYDYSYTLSDVRESQTIEVVYAEDESVSSDWLYIKQSDGTWKLVDSVYQHAGNCWWSITRDELKEKLADKTIFPQQVLKFTNDEYLDKRTLLFEDDFDDGELNTEVWTPETGYCRNTGSLAYYTPDALSFEDSCLVITATKTDGLPNAHTSSSSWALTYKSGSIQSQDKYLIKYGRVQAKIKCPKLAGTWPAWWLFGNDRKFSEYHTDGTILTETGTEWSECGEIDIVEQYGTAGQYEWNLWQSQTGAGSSYKNGTYTLDPSEWHIYEIEWTESTMTFMVDGVDVSGSIDLSATQCQAYLNSSFFMILNLQIGGTAGSPSADEMKMYVDWVRVYDREKGITITYNCGNYTEIEDDIAISSAYCPTTVSATQGASYYTKLFPLIGYKFDTVSITMGDEDITSTAYNSNIKEIQIDSVTDDVTITTETSIDTVGHAYRPIQTLPTGYSELTINGSSGVALNGYTLNPGYNIASATTTFNIELVMPDDYIFDVDTKMIVPEEMNFKSGVSEASSSSISNGVINDASVAGMWPMWNLTNWDSNNYFVFVLPISIVGTSLEEVNAWLDKNPITVYYPSQNAVDEAVANTSAGEIDTTTNTINLSDALSSDTYTLVYEDSSDNTIDGWGSIGTITT